MAGKVAGSNVSQNSKPVVRFMDTIVLRDGRRGKAVMQLDGEWWISIPWEKPVLAPWSEIASVIPRDPIIQQLLDGHDDAKQ